MSSDLVGGGTTDYAIEMVQAAKNRIPYTCFLAPQTELPMVYIDDVIMAMQKLMEADFSTHQRTHSYKIMGFLLTPKNPYHRESVALSVEVANTRSSMAS